MKGFAVAADAIVRCKVCGASEGQPCRGDELKIGYVHVGRRVARLLLTARATADERAAFERKVLQLLREDLRRLRIAGA